MPFEKGGAVHFEDGLLRGGQEGFRRNHEGCVYFDQQKEAPNMCEDCGADVFSKGLILENPSSDDTEGIENGGLDG